MRSTNKAESLLMMLWLSLKTLTGSAKSKAISMWTEATQEHSLKSLAFTLSSTVPKHRTLGSCSNRECRKSKGTWSFSQPWKTISLLPRKDLSSSEDYLRKSFQSWETQNKFKGRLKNLDLQATAKLMEGTCITSTSSSPAKECSSKSSSSWTVLPGTWQIGISP